MARFRVAIIALTIGMMLFGVLGCGKKGSGPAAPDPTTIPAPPPPAAESMDGTSSGQ